MARYRVIGADGREYGPISREELRRWIGQSRVNRSTRVCAEDSVDWRSLGSVEEFRPFVAGDPFAGGPGGPVTRRTNTWAIWGFVCGLLSLTLCSCCCLPLDLLGLIFSIIGLVQINNHPETQSGTALAVAGLVLSSLSILMGFAFSAFWLSTDALQPLLGEPDRGLSLGTAWFDELLAAAVLVDPSKNVTA
jgi:hypothetical protein